ncbi:hypothetical protein IKE67_07645, partial [bacterium]|nr:hypothetical protein [bacterium]
MKYNSMVFLIYLGICEAVYWFFIMCCSFNDHLGMAGVLLAILTFLVLILTIILYFGTIVWFIYEILSKKNTTTEVNKPTFYIGILSNIYA